MRTGVVAPSRSLLVAVLLGCLLVPTACTADAGPEPAASAAGTPSRAAPTLAAPTLATMDEAIEDYVTSGDDSLDNITSVLVTVDGRTITEFYRGRGSADRPTHLWSVTKSYLSTLVGIALAEGKLSDLDDPLRKLLPDHRDAMSRQVSGITLRQLMTMTAGIPGDEVYAQLPDTDLDTFLKLPLASKPGTEFRYSSASTELVAAVLTEAVRQPLLDYARVKLFDPLGIKTEPAYTGTETFDPTAAFDRADFAWARTTDGIFHGCCLMKLTGRDMQKLGQLYLQQGRWQGRQLVPASWVALATSPTEIAPDYGYLWWIGQTGRYDAYSAIGRYGQVIEVIPELKAVVTVSSWSNPAAPLDADLIVPMIRDVIVPRIR
ncbi:MAG: serine hydrolase [Propionibacteriaceae bacterium]